MSFPSRLLVVVVTLLSGAVSPAVLLAQERPVIFLHGLASSPDTWLGASERLRQQTSIVPFRPTLNWTERYAAQANALQADPWVATLPGHLTIAVGHSNGGVVARQWSRMRPFSGIVTLGTPHAGAPLVSRFTEWASYASATSLYVGLVHQAFNRPSGTSWVAGQVHPMLGWVLGFAQSAVLDVAGSLAIDWRLPVMEDMRPGSAFLRDLNSQANLSREAFDAPRRAGVISYAHNFYWAGPMRAAFPEHADAIAASLYSTIAGIDFWAAWILANAPHGDPAAIDQAQALFSLAGHLASLDPIFCAMVSSASSYDCVPNDGAVPHTSQRYPNALNLVVGTDGSWGPVHTRLTQQSDDTLYRLLVEVMQVEPRSQAPPPDGPVTTPPPSPGDPESDPSDASGHRQDVLRPGDAMRPGDSVWSHEGRFELVYQGDGNLVLYRQGDALWSSGTDGSQAGLVVMQHDGNLVIYDANDHPVWSNDGSFGYAGAWLIVQDDGNVVVYSDGGEPLWATGTSQ